MKIMLATPLMKERRVDIQYMPLGLGYISSVLKNAGHEVEILDVRIECLSKDKIVQKIKEYKPVLLGVTATTCQINDAADLIHLIKLSFPEIITVLGGPHISALPQLTLQEFSSIDIGVVGEGETTILELVNSITSKNSLAMVSGIVYRDHGNILLSKSRCYIDDLDLVPFPDRQAFPLDLYLNNAIEYKGKPIASIITSRGCPYGCPFCCKSTFGGEYRSRSRENVISELEYLVEVQKYKEIHIFDDNFTFDEQRAIDICNDIIKKKWNIHFALPNGIHIANFNDELALLMRRAGFYFLWFGVETGDPEVLKTLRKGVDIEQISEAVSIAKRHGFFTGMYFVVGLPGSSPKSELMSLELAKKLKPDVIGVSVCTAYPGSSIFDESKYTDWRYYRHDFAEHHFTSENFDEEYILEQFDMISQGFYFMPLYYMGLIKRHGMFALRRVWINFKNYLFRRLK